MYSIPDGTTHKTSPMQVSSQSLHPQAITASLQNPDKIQKYIILNDNLIDLCNWLICVSHILKYWLCVHNSPWEINAGGTSHTHVWSNWFMAYVRDNF